MEGVSNWSERVRAGVERWKLEECVLGCRSKYWVTRVSTELRGWILR